MLLVSMYWGLTEPEILVGLQVVQSGDVWKIDWNKLDVYFK